MGGTVGEGEGERGAADAQRTAAVAMCEEWVLSIASECLLFLVQVRGEGGEGGKQGLGFLRVTVWVKGGRTGERKRRRKERNRLGKRGPHGKTQAFVLSPHFLLLPLSPLSERLSPSCMMRCLSPWLCHNKALIRLPCSLPPPPPPPPPPFRLRSQTSLCGPRV